MGRRISLHREHSRGRLARDAIPSWAGSFVAACDDRAPLPKPNCVPRLVTVNQELWACRLVTKSRRQKEIRL